MDEKTDVVEAVRIYQEWRQSRGIAASTIRRDGSTLTNFIKTTGRLKVSSLTTAHVDRFFLTRSSLSPQTQNLDLATLRTFFSFLETRGYHKRATGLLMDYKALKYTVPPRRRLSIGEFPALLECASSPRERIVIALGLFTFMRASEIRLLRIKDVNLATDEISVRVPKTKDSDIMPISAEMGDEMRRWLTYYTGEFGKLDPEWFLVPGQALTEWERGEHGQIVKPISRQLVPTAQVRKPHEIVKQALKRLGWSDVSREGVHTLRRSGARALYDELAASDGHSNALETVSAMLHHSVMATTQIYLGLTESRRKRDRLIAGKPMFPSLVDHSITPLVPRQNLSHG